MCRSGKVFILVPISGPGMHSVELIKRRFGIIGKAAALDEAVAQAMKLAPTSMNVLITGENGVGKESFSHIIHYLSPQRKGKLIAINCGALPEGTIDAELFGHEKGAFTGAEEQRKGYFQEASGGTIFLDEVGELPLHTQARLLRVLEYGEYLKVGSSKVEKSDARIIAATHVDLLEAVSQGKFREDLYYRLSTLALHIPPLRERGEDIMLLFRKFAADFAERHQKLPIQLDAEAREILLTYDFPGNVRQLRNLVMQLAALEEEHTAIPPARLLAYLPQRRLHLPARVSAASLPAGLELSRQEALYDLLCKLQEEQTEARRSYAELKKELTDLRRMLLDLLMQLYDPSQVAQSHPHLFRDLASPLIASAAVRGQAESLPKLLQASQPEASNDPAQDEHSLNLEESTRKNILKALGRPDFNRKKAARQLGISERTLYRKIKALGLQGHPDGRSQKGG